jgi:hypothetical protein
LRLRLYIFVPCLLLALALAGCGTRLYDVAAVPKAMPAGAVAGVTAKGLEVSAAALAEDDEAFARYGGNLPLAGVVAVDVRVANRADKELKTGGLKFELRDAAGKRLKQIDAKKALKRLMKLNQIETYLIEAHRRTREDFAATALPRSATLEPQGEVRGVLFFDAKRDAAKLGPLTLTVKGGATPIQLQLN